MRDRISNYRSVRLVIHPSQTETGWAEWALVLETVRKGIPHASLEARGRVELVGATPSVSAIWAAIRRVAEGSEEA